MYMHNININPEHVKPILQNKVDDIKYLNILYQFKHAIVSM